MNLVGNTPVARVEGVFAKLECVNPCGSVKDRIAKFIIEQSERLGILAPGMTIVEATSGNTGIAFAYYGKQKGYGVNIVMPEHMTEERKDLIRKLGANLILCSKEGSFAEAVEIRDRIASEQGAFNPDQFSNPLNVECHFRTTGQEIIRQISHRNPQSVAFIAGVGTGGTLMGVGRALRLAYPRVRLVAVEPSESAVMGGGAPGPHGIFGIGDGFIPPIVGNGQGGVSSELDEVVRVSTEDAIEASHRLRAKHGICVGISSGANFLAASRFVDEFDAVVTVFADGYSKYASHGLLHAGEGRCPFGERCPEPIPSRGEAQESD
ncbi:MAG: Cysteine synthase [Fimbriimonadales bacterium]|nr:Cysteine synthase [Fimbriimonadales bacterium]